MLRPKKHLATAILALAVSILGGCDDETAEAEAAQSEAPSQFDRDLPPEPEPEPEPEEETIAYGVAREERTFVRVEPREDARAIGIIRWGQQFEITETRQIDEATWHEMKGAGWVRDADVVTRTSAPPELGFAPRPPDLEDPMPYPIARVVTEDGVPVYRRPPRRGEDPERVRMRNLQEGYFFTVDKWVNIYDRQMYRGTRYWFIPRAGTDTVREPDFEGIEVDESVELPFLWVTDPTARLCEEIALPDEEAPTCHDVERHTRLPLVDTHRTAGTWYETRNEEGETRYIASLQVSRVHRIDTRPEGIYRNERWIHVDLSNQFAALYEGDDMVFVTLVSSGDDGHETPTGFFRVESRHVTATMDDEDNLSSPYFIQDVPWVLYFKGGYALHGAFWHDRFGLTTSHGCVNLSPADALRFYQFTDSPEIREGFHAVFTPPESRSTAVVITE